MNSKRPRWTPVLIAGLFLTACSRENNPLLALPGPGVTSSTLAAPQIETHDEPFNKVFLRVLDNTSTPIQNFRIGNFSLLENGRPVPIEEVGIVNDPLYIALVIDRSGSMVGSNETAANTAASSLVSALGPTDQMAILEFSNAVAVSVPFTSDSAALNTVLVSSRSAGGTALYDATATGAATLKNVQGRKLLIVLTDGDDTASTKTLSSAVDGVNEAGVSAFMVALGVGIDLSTLQQIAGATNGEAFFDLDGTGLTAIFLNILSVMQDLVYVKYRKRSVSGVLTIYLNYGALTANTTRRY